MYKVGRVERPRTKKAKPPRGLKAKLYEKPNGMPFLFFPEKKVGEEYIVIFDGRLFRTVHESYLDDAVWASGANNKRLLGAVGQPIHLINNIRPKRMAKPYTINLTQEEYDAIVDRYGKLSTGVRMMAYYIDRFRRVKMIAELEED